MNQKITQTCQSEKIKDISKRKRFFNPKLLLLVFGVSGCLMLTTGNVAADDNLTLSNNGKRAILKNRYLQLVTNGFSMKITTEDGTKYAIGNNIRAELDSIVELINTKKEKHIELKSKKFSIRGRGDKNKYEFLLRLKLHVDSPVLEVESRLKNIGEHPVSGYYFWNIGPAYSDVYFSNGRFMVDTPGNLNVEDWGYFPTPENRTGFGLVGNTGQSGFFLKTIYPRNIWRKIGWYICKRNSKLPKGKSSSINFILIPTESLEKFQNIYQNIIEKKKTK